MNKHTLQQARKTFAVSLHLCSILVTAIFFSCFTIEASAQQNALPYVTIKVENTPIVTVFQTIQQQTGFSVIYNNSDIDSNRKVTLSATDAALNLVLDQLFSKTDVTYTIRDKYIVLSKKMMNPAATQVLAGGGISGTVKDDKGLPLIGANVIIKGTTHGAAVDIDGNFLLPMAKPGDVLEISLIGYSKQEIIVRDKTPIQVVLHEDNAVLDAVVVTALGIKRQEKALSYNVQQVKSEELTTVKDANFMNSLNGKVAGVTINSSSTGVGGSTKVVMRGTKSISKNNNALYVIDGIPMFNPTIGSNGAALQGDQPGTDAVADINPEDIESINMLTGPSAAALYGNAAANGVVLINTKKGQKDKTTVSYSNNTTFSMPYMMPEMQNRYGNSPGAFESWSKVKGSNFGYYDPRDFFDTGVNTMNAVSFSTGTARNQTYVSAATTNASGIIPNNTYERYNFSFRNTASFLKDKLTLDVGGSYIIQKDKNMTGGGQYFNPIPALYLFPRGDSFDEVRMYERWNSARGIYEQYWPYTTKAMGLQNPFWVVNRMNRENRKKRYMFNASLKYQPLEWLDITGRIRLDNSANRYTKKLHASTDLTWAGKYGNYEQVHTNDYSFYSDVMLNINKIWDNWSVSANIGASINDIREEMVGYGGNLRGNANFFSIHNLDYTAKFKPKAANWHDQSQALFANVEVGWKSMLYLTLTGRNDWESQLAYSANSSFFYPSIGLSAVVSNMVNMPKWISFFKVRGSYTEVANSFDRYRTLLTYPFDEESKGWDSDAVYPFRDLQPEKTKSWEVGFNLKLWNHLNIDMTYYRSNTYDQTFSIKLPSASGYESAYVQTGNIQNQGIELGVGYNNKWGDFRWSTHYNFTWNENEVIDVNNGARNPLTGEPIEMNEFEIASYGNLDARVLLRKGGSMGDVYINHMLRTDMNGRIWVDPDSDKLVMDQVPDKKIGSVLPDFNMGWNNTFSWKGIDLGIVLTARIGGIVLGGTQAELDKFGVSEVTAATRDCGGVPVNNGLIPAETYYTTIAGYGAYYAYSATNVRLSELSLSYRLPAKWFRNKVRMSVGFTAQNLWMIYCKAPFDPELSPSTTAALYAGYDYFMQPSLRNLGFSVKLQF